MKTTEEIKTAKELAERIEKLCKLQGRSINDVFSKHNFSPSTLSNMKSNGAIPSAYLLTKVAIELNSTCEYLLFGETQEMSRNSIFNNGNVEINGVQTNEYVDKKELSLEEVELLQIYRGLSFRKKVELLNRAIELDER